MKKILKVFMAPPDKVPLIPPDHFLFFYLTWGIIVMSTPAIWIAAYKMGQAFGYEAGYEAGLKANVQEMLMDQDEMRSEKATERLKKLMGILK